VCVSYVANKLLESGDRDQLVKLIGRVQGFIFSVLLAVSRNGYGGERWQVCTNISNIIWYITWHHRM